MYSTKSRIDFITTHLPKNPVFHPWPFDDVSLAFSLGIRAKTLWWLVLKNNPKDQARGAGMYKEFKIPKSTGGVRVIHEPYPALKNVQKSILVTYLNPLPVGPWIGAYVPGRSMLDSVARHAGAKVKVSMDIKDFFGSTRRGWIRQWMYGLGLDKDVVKPLSSLVTIPRELEGGKVLSVLPQGAPTSGAVANLVAQERLDAPLMRSLFQVEGLRWVYTRYSDNLEVSLLDELPTDEVDQVLHFMKTAIHGAGYRWNPKKTHVQRHNSPRVGMRMLGFTINEKPNIPKQEYRRLRAMVHNCVTKGPETQFARYGADSAPQMLSSLKGRLIYWRSVAPWKMQPLLDKLETLDP